ncbi:YcgN family cysteine cluster protein [Pokkaliibacter sp. CJK22405]|uniref:YcgN family cysteine cluster protein n=1 Tax=Pokkaliibacter sp. CJK22405 TaxID=3384615 RepID=UPI003984819A
MIRERFWEQFELEAFTHEEWEALCDGCGKCCLHKLEDEDTNEVHYSRVACKELNLRDGGCLHYGERFERVPGCVQMTPELVRSVNWLHPTCSYRVVAEKRPLHAWHPLVSGKESTRKQGRIQLKRVAISERVVPEDADWELLLIDVTDI